MESFMLEDELKKKSDVGGRGWSGKDQSKEEKEKWKVVVRRGKAKHFQTNDARVRTTIY